MTNRFHGLHDKNKPLFIPFIVAGDPSPEITIDLAISLENTGADVLELGIPYSDPLADGPVIQQAALRALQQQMTIEKAMNLVGRMRERGLTIPVVIFSYYNLILQLGMERFTNLAYKNQIDGLLIPDLPFEESNAIRCSCEQNDISYISLVAPTTSDDRLKVIARDAKGFLYAVSSLGVTGERQQFHTQLGEFLIKVKQYAEVPLALGFGVSSKKQFNQFGSMCDGVIIGSAIVRKIEALQEKLIREETREDALLEFSSYVSNIIGKNAAVL
jgi:tryptophan synthase alpha chain